MKTALRVILVLLMLACMLVLVPSGAIVAQAEIVEIPLDAAGGMPPLEEGYLSLREYRDPSISVVIETGRYEDTNYMTARITLANASQLRSALSSKSYLSPVADKPTRIAERVKAVFAINGDFYGENYGRGVMIRQGKQYRAFKANTYYRHERAVGNWDILMLDEQGDMHILKAAEKADVEDFLARHTVVNSFNFGPGLIIDGEPQTGYKNMNDAADIPAQRMAFCQTGPLEYLCVYSEGPQDEPDKNGLTLQQMTDLLVRLGGIQNAYCMDGGSSAQMIFRSENAAYDKINSSTPGKAREVYDILYFVSAYVPD